VFIAAGGYIINDYFDLRIDIINRPQKVILEKQIPLRLAIIAHSALNIVALMFALYVAWQAHCWWYVSLQLGCTVLLWFYSTHFKRQFITGNVVVACLTALTIITLVVYEPFLHLFVQQPAILTHRGENYINPFWMCIGYCFFAFMLTWMREIVKDMEDHIGDSHEGCLTMPIKMGLQFSIRFTQGLGIITLSVLVALSLMLLRSEYYVLTAYVHLLVIAPLVAWCIFAGRKNTIAHYKKSSRYLKLIMISGIDSLIIYHFTVLSIL
jgi:4-hydroxybenzoate polyprenyltransferase